MFEIARIDIGSANRNDSDKTFVVVFNVQGAINERQQNADERKARTKNKWMDGLGWTDF